MAIEQPASLKGVPQLAVRAQGSDRTLQPGPSYTVGRDPQSDLVIGDDRVSWQHAVLRVEEGAWVLADVGSTNGTYLDGQRVDKAVLAGDRTFRLGHPVDGPALACSVAAPARTATERVQIDHVLAQGVPAQGVPAQGVPAQGVPGQGALTDAGAGRSAPAYSARDRGESTAGHRVPSMIRKLPTTALRIGRASDNDVVVPDLSVSRYHAELRNTGGGNFQIVDVGSHNGTFVNGLRVAAAPITPADAIAIGPSTFRLVGDELQEFVDTGDISLVARDLTVKLSSGKVLLDRVSFPLGERCLLGIIGPSGAGKSTLLGALTGLRPATEGSVLYDDRDLYSHYAELRHRIGLVPQENILHTQLTARRALRYAAELRFPRDTSAAERNRRVDEVLEELSLSAHGETRTDRLSGGQQKRVNVALELMTKPSLLFLDEPTSGLDPGLDKSVMEMMRDLAHDGRTVIVVTHSVANLDICDRLLVLVPGGRVAYFGPPQDGLRHFGKPGWAEVFQAFEHEPNRDWAGEYRRSPWYAQYVRDAIDGRSAASTNRLVLPPPASKNRFAQFSTLCRRYLSVIASDRVYLALLAGAPVVLGGVILVIPDKDGLAGAPVPAKPKATAHAAKHHHHHATAPPTPAPTGAGAHATAHATATAGHVVPHVTASASAVPPGTNNAAASLLLILIISACFAGAFNAVRELVKERAIYNRERAAGLSPASYLGSKLAVLGLISGVQAAVMVLIGLIGRKLPPSGAFVHGLPLLELILAISLLAVVSMAVGLLISASVNTSEKTMPILMVLVVVEVILTGGVFAINGKVGLEQVAWLSPSRWGYAATSSTANLSKLMPPAPGAKADPLWAHNAHTWLLDVGVLCLLGVVFAVIAWWRLLRQGPGRRRA